MSGCLPGKIGPDEHDAVIIIIIIVSSRTDDSYGVWHREAAAEASARDGGALGREARRRVQRQAAVSPRAFLC